jgi:hypothetical protein
MSDSIQKIKYPELFFGFVAPIGADLLPVLQAFKKYFETRQYRIVEIKATEIFDVLEKYVIPKTALVKTNDRERYETYIAYGNQLREKFDDAILAATTIRRVMARRLRVQKDGEKFSGTVYLLHQFKRKEEVDLLRTTYGRLFFQISIYSRRGTRIDYLSKRFASHDHGAPSQKYRPAAEELIQKDENEIGEFHGQRVATIFHDADFIANLDVAEAIHLQVNRFGELIFGSNSYSQPRPSMECSWPRPQRCEASIFRDKSERRSSLRTQKSWLSAPMRCQKLAVEHIGRMTHTMTATTFARSTPTISENGKYCRKLPTSLIQKLTSKSYSRTSEFVTLF